MSELRIVTPDDIGNTIVMGSDNKYNVAVDQLQLPDNITGLSLEGSTLKITTRTGEHTQDLSQVLPTIANDVFIKNVERQDNNLVFTVGNKNNTNDDNTFTIGVSDLLPVKVGNSLTGNGTAASPLNVKVAELSGTNNLLKDRDPSKHAQGYFVNDGGLFVAEEDVLRAVRQDDIKLKNASGETTLGYIRKAVVYASL